MSYDLGTAHGKITLDYNGDRAVERAEDDIDKLARKARDGDKSFARLGKTLGAIGSAVRITAITVALTNAAISAGALAIQVAGVIPALVSILSLASVIPGAFIAIGAAAGALAAIFSGVGDAITAAFDTESPEKFNKALEKLSPTAQKFAKSIKEVAPELRAFQQEMQEAFFKTANLSARLPLMMKGLQTLRPALLGVAAGFGGLARQAVSFAVSSRTIDFVNDAVQILSDTLDAARVPMVSLLTGLRNVGEVGLPLLRQLGAAVNSVAQRFGEWLSEIAADGRLQAWINTALQTLSTLGDIASNLGSILMSVLDAAAESGGGLLNTISEITGQFAAFLKSAEGSAAIRSLFTGIMEIARQLAPIFTTLVRILANALGPALGRIATTIGPILLDVLKRLEPAIKPLADALADLLVAVAPLLPPLAQLAALLIRYVATAVSALVAELGPLISVFAQGLTQAIEAFMPVIGEMAKGLPLAARAGAQLAAAFAPLVPVMVELARTIATSLVAVMPQLLAAAEDLVPVIVEFAKAFSVMLADGLRAIIPLLPSLINAFVILAPLILQVTTFGLRLVTWCIQLANGLRMLIGAVISFVAQFVSGFLNAVTGAYNTVITVGAAILNWFTTLPEKIMAGLRALPGLLRNFFSVTLRGLATLIGTAAGLLVGIFTRLPQRILSGIVRLASALPDFFRSVWANVQRITSSAWNSIVSFMSNIPRRIRSAVNALPGLLSALIRNAWNSARSAFVSGANAVIGIARAIPGRIRSALGSVGGLLVGAGRSIINGLANGISSGIGRVLGMVRGLAARVRSAFNSALSIFSPSKDFYESGVNIVKGLLNALKDQMSNVGRTAQVLANTVIQPTLNLPAAATAAANGLSTMLSPVTATTTNAEAGTFGPYEMVLDGKVVASFVVDTITGNPTVVSKAANEGDRKKTWTGKGS